MTNIECPVCNSIITGNVCGKCGYVRIVFPKAVSDTIIRFERERVDALRSIMKKTATDMADAKRNAESARRRSESLDRELEDSKSKTIRLGSECEKLKAENNRLTYSRQTLEKEYENLRSNTSIKERKLKDEVMQLSATISKQSNEIASLNAGLSEANSKLLSVTENKRAYAYLIFVDGNDYSVYPIYNDRAAFFASGPGRSSKLKNVDDVTLLPVITGIEIAFGIQRDRGGFRIEDYCGTVRKEGCQINGNERLMNKESLSFNGTTFKAFFTIPPRKR